MSSWAGFSTALLQCAEWYLFRFATKRRISSNQWFSKCLCLRIVSDP